MGCVTKDLDSRSATVGAITARLQEVKQGRRDALGPLWELCRPRMLTFVRSQLRQRYPGAYDQCEEDVALEVFFNIWQGIDSGRFPEIRTSENFWYLFFCIARR